MKRNNITCIIGIAMGVGLDMLSKYLFYDMRYRETFPLFTPAFNEGISRSLPVPLNLVMLISIVGIGAFIRLFVTKKINRIISALLIAGTAGNLIDRIFLGGVRDFIDIGIFNFPIFNVADIMLTIGVLVRIAGVMLEKRK